MRTSGLFDLVADPEDEIFLNIRDLPCRVKQREWLGRLWERFHTYADKQFLIEIGRDFYARFWEMWLACELLNQGFILDPDRPSEGPDFCILSDDKRIWIEAVAPRPGTGEDAVDFSEEEGGWIPEPKIILRYQNAVIAKHEKLQGYLEKKIVKEGESYVIAVYGTGIPGAGWDDPVPYAVQAVFPIGPLTGTPDLKLMKVVNWRYAYRPCIRKISGGPVPTTTFLKDQFNGISALISGNPDPIEMLNPRLKLILNPLAKNPLPPDWLKRGIVYWKEGNTLQHRNFPESN